LRLVPEVAGGMREWEVGSSRKITFSPMLTLSLYIVFPSWSSCQRKVVVSAGTAYNKSLKRSNL
jgi:hypothetical protein